MEQSTQFWQNLDELIRRHRVRIDRPKGSRHPRFEGFIYPLDYGYLRGTKAKDGESLDVWVGSVGDGKVTGLIVNVDLLKKDSEVKILIGCSSEEMKKILKTHNQGSQSAILIKRK